MTRSVQGGERRREEERGGGTTLRWDGRTRGTREAEGGRRRKRNLLMARKARSKIFCGITFSNFMYPVQGGERRREEERGGERRGDNVMMGWEDERTRGKRGKEGEGGSRGANLLMARKARSKIFCGITFSNFMYPFSTNSLFCSRVRDTLNTGRGSWMGREGAAPGRTPGEG
jgi:hypothetical protein